MNNVLIKKEVEVEFTHFQELLQPKSIGSFR